MNPTVSEPPSSPSSRSSRYLILLAIFSIVFGIAHAGRVRAANNTAYHAAPDDNHAGHMTMTTLGPTQPGDQARAAAIAAAARTFADRYTDYHKALADGYAIFHPEIKQKVYHFTNNLEALETTIHFDPAAPTSLLYEKTVPITPGEPSGYKLVGVMYTAAFRATPEELDRRVPLSIAQWHLHTNLCLPPAGDSSDLASPNARFGLQGSITTADACQAAGGRFIPHLFGWMVHVYPYETDPAKVWSAGMGDDRGMQHGPMPSGMPM